MYYCTESNDILEVGSGVVKLTLLGLSCIPFWSISLGLLSFSLVSLCVALKMFSWGEPVFCHWGAVMLLEPDISAFEILAYPTHW